MAAQTEPGLQAFSLYKTPRRSIRIRRGVFHFFAAPSVACAEADGLADVSAIGVCVGTTPVSSSVMMPSSSFTIPSFMSGVAVIGVPDGLGAFVAAGFSRRAARAERNNQRRERKNIYDPLFSCEILLNKKSAVSMPYYSGFITKSNAPEVFRAHCFLKIISSA